MLLGQIERQARRTQDQAVEAVGFLREQRLDAVFGECPGVFVEALPEISEFGFHVMASRRRRQRVARLPRYRH